MHLSRDTHNLLNESIRSLSLEEEYDILTEEQFNEAYEDYIDFLVENYTDEELENMTEEELLEGFLSRVTGAMGTAKDKIKTGIKSMGKTWDDMKTQYRRGAAGELTWTGAEKYPVKKEEEKPEPKSEEKPEPKSTGRGIIPVRPSALDKSTKDIPMGTETDDEKKVAPEKTEKTKKKPNYLGVKPMKKGDIDSTYEKVFGKNWKSNKTQLEKMFKNKGVDQKHFKKLHTHYLSMRGLGAKKVGVKHGEALKNLFERKQYYRELVQRLLENYKK